MIISVSSESEVLQSQSGNLFKFIKADETGIQKNVPVDLLQS